jgi:hypothetical protein
MPLEMDDIKSPWYGVFDHLIPLDPRTIVLTFALVNDMKTALSVGEFWYYIRQLANYKRYHLKVKKKKPRYWSRLTIRELHLKSLRD